MEEEFYNTVPLIVDDIKKYEGFEMTRCSYFTIEADEPIPNVTLTLEQLTTFPFLLIGLQGIITAPDNEGGLFDNPDIIDQHFDSIEETGLLVDIETIWLPNFMFNHYEVHDIGNVYRISSTLFSEAYKYAEGKETKTDFIKFCQEADDVIFSGEETHAFDQWAERQIEESKIFFENNRDQALEYDENKGGNLLTN